MAFILKRGKMHYALWYEVDGGGKRKQRWKALARDRDVAEKMLKDIKSNNERKGAGLPQHVSWTAFLDRYLKFIEIDRAPSTVVRVQIVLKHLSRLFPITDLLDITPEVLEKYQSLRIEAGIDAATVNKELGIIRAAVRRGRKKWKYETHDLSDVDKLTVPEKVKVSFRGEQVRLMLEQADPLFKMIIRLGVYAGLRRDEILQVRWQDVDWQEHRVTIGDGWKTKTSKIRVLPLHPKLEDSLKAWKAVMGSSECIIPWGRRSHQLSSMFTHFLRKRCGIARGTLHSLRHTFVTSLQRKDVLGEKVQRLAGHESVRTTEIYSHLDIRDLSDTVSRLDFEEGAPPEPTGA